MSDPQDMQPRRVVPDDFGGVRPTDAGGDPTVAYATTGQSVAGSGRRRVAVVVGLVAAALVAGGAVAVASVLPSDDGAQRPNRPGVGGAASVEPSASTGGVPSKPGNVYRAVDRPCEAADFSVLEKQFGPARGSPLQGSTRTSARTSMSCTTGFGRSGGTVVMQIEVLAGADSQIMFDGLRRVHVQESPVTEVAGLGAAAYAYVNEDVGTYVVAYDANLYMSVAWSTLGAAPRAPQRELTVLLAEVCRKTMANLAA